MQVSEPDIWPLAIQGPRAQDVAALVLGEQVKDIKFFRSARLAFRGHEFVVARSGWSAQGGFEIYVDDVELGCELYDALMLAGKSFDIGPGCPNAIERIEAGLLSYGNDVTRKDTALEAGLDRYCALDAPIDAIGRDALRRQAAEGVGRRICGLKISGDGVPPIRNPWPVSSRGTNSGAVTSAAWSPRLGTNVALGMLAIDLTVPGTEVAVEMPGGTRQAVVTEVPFAGASQR